MIKPTGRRLVWMPLARALDLEELVDIWASEGRVGFPLEG
jgi:hypothetical protein